MNCIVAVYENWGIGCGGTQPLALSADRKFFRAATMGCPVIVGRRTAADFPGGQPLPGRENYLLSRSREAAPGFALCRSPEEAAQRAGEGAFVIGGGSVYCALLPMCDTAYVTKIFAAPSCDTFFPNLDADNAWERAALLQSGEENAVRYEIWLYKRR
ncbi:MAG: dihydrofolate reductase [Firmicutes bacterium]|nr:dihydrofolate reductase [Bacillota bacterium]